jgi:hypothetical protein
MNLLVDALLASAGMPRWVWAALLMAAFVGVSVLTMLLTRYPVRRAPPPVTPPDADQPPPADA